MLINKSRFFCLQNIRVPHIIYILYTYDTRKTKLTYLYKALTYLIELRDYGNKIKWRLDN